MHFQGPARRGCSNSGHDTSYATPQTEDEGILSAEIGSSDSSPSVDEDDVNERLSPFWPKYQQIFREHNLNLDTIRDVKGYGPRVQRPFHTYQSEVNDDALCPDPCLPDRLFRGTRLLDRRRFVAKAVHPRSRECEVISRLSCPSLRNDTMNHTIPIMDILRNEDAKDNVMFIVMEAWSPQVLAQMCCPQRFMAGMRQWLEHVVFMHKHYVAHLDISLRNLVTDGGGRYAYIDFEQSRYFPPTVASHLVYNYHGTEEPPECADQTCVNPFKVDIWALGVLILRACKLTGIWVPELMELISPMLNKDPTRRPGSSNVLQAFDRIVAVLGDRLGPPCENSW